MSKTILSKDCIGVSPMCAPVEQIYKLRCRPRHCYE